MHLLLPILVYRAHRARRAARAGAARPTPPPSSPATAPAPNRRGGLARVAAYVGLVALTLGALGARRAQAEVGHEALAFGRELGTLTEDGAGGTVRLNGERFHVAERAVAGSVSETLDTYERACRERPGAVAELFEALPAHGSVHGQGYTLPEAFSHGVVRHGSEREGVVVCLLGDPKSRRGLAAALGAFAASQDLGALGELRYAYARRVEGAGSAGTRLTLAWTDASFDLKKLTSGGEATGDDGRAPRPSGARRLLVAEVVGAPHVTRMYECDSPPTAVAAHYDGALMGAGFQRLTPTSQAHVLRAYFRADLHVFVAIRRQGERTVFAVTESSGVRAARSTADEAQP